MKMLNDIECSNIGCFILSQPTVPPPPQICGLQVQKAEFHAVRSLCGVCLCGDSFLLLLVSTSFSDGDLSSSSIGRTVCVNQCLELGIMLCLVPEVFSSKHSEGRKRILSQICQCEHRNYAQMRLMIALLNVNRLPAKREGEGNFSFV
jgi:hypothetical protein